MLSGSHDTGHGPGNDPAQDDAVGRPRQMIAAIVLLALIVAASLWITGALRGAARIQDCVAAGRSNCAPVDAPAR